MGFADKSSVQGPFCTDENIFVYHLGILFEKELPDFFFTDK